MVSQDLLGLWGRKVIEATMGLMAYLDGLD
jgi:hypothetical protein